MLKHKLNFLSFIFLKDYCLGVNAVQQFMKDFNTANDNTTSEENNPRSQPRRLVDVSTKKLLPSVSWHQNVAAPKLSLNNAEGNSVHAQFDFLGKLKGWGFFPEVILDVGANRGDWAQTAYRAFSNQTHKSRVLCFEGSDNRKEDLMKLPFEFTIAVVGSKSEPIKFFDNPSANTGNSIFTEKTGFFDNVQPKTVMMWRLDDLIADKAVKEGKGAIYPQLLKIDVQGKNARELESQGISLSYPILQIVFGKQFMNTSL
jgi:FkbM family methyltransferase